MNKLSFIRTTLHIVMLIGIVFDFTNKTGIILYLLAMIINELLDILKGE